LQVVLFYALFSSVMVVRALSGGVALAWGENAEDE
jgi:hypothetical protein